MLGTQEDFLPALFDVGQVGLIPVDGTLNVFLALMNALAFVLPVFLVSDDILQILVALDVVTADNL